MSTWTHVAGIIRIDGLPDVTPKPNLGPVCRWGDGLANWDRCTLPKGTEGSLDYTVWENPNPSHAARYTVSLFGDLRDYDSIDDIIRYARQITDGQIVRQGALTVEVESGPQGIVTRNFVYHADAWQMICAI